MSEEISQHLKQAREARDEHLTEACERSGISLAILQGLEAARFDTVEPIYMRLGLRSYSEYLGLDTAALLNAFDKDVATRLPDDPVPPAVPRPQKPRGGRVSSISRRQVVAVVVLLLALVALAWMLVTEFSENGELQDTELAQPSAGLSDAGSEQASISAPTALLAAADSLPHSDPVVSDEESGERQTAGDEEIEPVLQDDLTSAEGADTPASNSTGANMRFGREYEALPNEASGNSASPANLAASPEVIGEPLDASALVLEVEAIDSTWVQVSWDGRDTFQGILAPGLKRRWVAREKFLVRSGRAHGARYWLQGNLLGNGRLGEATKVLRFRADNNGVTLLGPELEPLSLTPATSDAAE